MHRDDLVSGWIAQVGKIDLARGPFAPAGRIFDALAPVGHARVVESLDFLGTVAGKANGSAVGVGRCLAIDRLRDPKSASLGAIEDATLRIGFTLGHANGAEYGIVELLGRGDIIGPDHNVREHCVLSSFGNNEPSPGSRFVARSMEERAQAYAWSRSRRRGD